MGRDGKPVPYDAFTVGPPNSNFSAPKKKGAAGGKSSARESLCASFRPQPQTVLHAYEARDDHIQNHEGVAVLAQLLFLI